MPRYTDDTKQKVRDAVDFADLVGRYTELRGRGRLTGLCPFHEERTPSFGIDPGEKLFHCFGCGAGGDLFTFVELKEGLDFKGALEWLADRYGVELEIADEDPAEAERRRSRERLLELLERTATFYARNLWETAEAAPAREYLRERGLSEDVLREFRVGYAPSRWDTVLLASRRAGYSNREVSDAGLAIGGGERGRLHDRFRRRIMFPLCDRRGAVLGFGARALSPDQKPKYLNSADGPVYHKGRNVYAADVARSAASRAGFVVLAEGYTDVLALHQAGLKQTVGLMGTALTEEQVGELARLAPTVLLMLDADSAGQEAMLRAARVAAGKDVELRVVRMPEGKDPADLALELGPDEVRRLVDAAMPFTRFQVERLLGKADLATAEGKDAVIDELKPVFAGLPPSAVREELLRMVADKTDLPPAMVSSWLSQPAKGNGTAPARPARLAGPAGAAAPVAVPAPPVAAPPPPRIAPITPAVRAERAFLAQCVALGPPARTTLESLETDRLLSEPLHRRAAAHLVGHLDRPAAGIADEDRDLARLIAELVVGADRITPSAIALQIEVLKLELGAVERAITLAKTSGVGSIADLARRRNVLKDQLDVAMVELNAEQERLEQQRLEQERQTR